MGRRDHLYPPQRYAALGSNLPYLDGRQGVCRGLDVAPRMDRPYPHTVSSRQGLAALPHGGQRRQLSWQPVYFTDTPSWARAFRRIEGSDEHGDPAGCPRRRELSRPLSR